LDGRRPPGGDDPDFCRVNQRVERFIFHGLGDSIQVNMNKRSATEHDIDRVVQIYNSSVQWRLSTADTSPVSVESKTDWFNSHSECRPLFVYESDDGNIIGWASIQNFNDRPAYVNTVEISIYIDHDHIGKGIGSEILADSIESLRKIRIKTVIANVCSHNSASIKLFKNFDFIQWGELPDVCEMDGKFYSVSVLGLRLGSVR
jgi:phosphinothricin acetyltransferase